MANVRADIAQQRDIDENRFSPQASLNARMRAVVVAQRRLRLRAGRRRGLRQSLIDLAAVAELIAADLPTPKGTPAPR
jgi:hypothetical protein